MSKTVRLSVEEWCALCENGAKIPVEITLAGVSMEPLIRKNRDTITILPVEDEIRIGDIVLFRRADGAYVVHRVFRISGDTVVTLGDNCENPDPPIARAQILGKVKRIRRGSRTIETDSASQKRYGRNRLKLFPIRRRLFHYRFVIRKNLERTKE